MKKFEINIIDPICLNGTIQLKRGAVTFLKGDIGSGKTSALFALIPQLQDSYAFVCQKYLLLEEYSVEENFKIFKIPFSQMNDELDRFHLDIDVKKKVNELSEGMKQRLAVAIALARKPQYLILDEPISHLDEFNQISVLETIQEYTRINNSYTLIIDHSDHYKQYGDEIYQIMDHQIIIEKEFKNENEDSTYNQGSHLSIVHYLLSHFSHYQKEMLISFFLILIINLIGTVPKWIQQKQISSIEKEMSTYVIITYDQEVSDIYYNEFCELYPFTCLEDVYSNERIQLYPLVDYNSINDDEILIRKQDLTKYNLQLGDLISIQNKIYILKGTLDEQYFPVYQSNIDLIVYGHIDCGESYQMCGKLKNILEYPDAFEKIKQDSNVIDIQFSNTYTSKIVDYDINH